MNDHSLGISPMVVYEPSHRNAPVTAFNNQTRDTEDCKTLKCTAFNIGLVTDIAVW